VNVPWRLVAPGPGRSAELLMAADPVSGRQNVVANLMAAGTFRDMAPAAVPCVRIACTSVPAFEQMPPAPQSAAAAQAAPTFGPAMHMLLRMNVRQVPPPGQSAVVRHGPLLLEPPKQMFVGNAPFWSDVCPGQNCPFAAVADAVPVVSGFSEIANVPTHDEQMPAGHCDAVVHAPPEFDPP
jgi:hypothetical protein